ncbi:DsbA family oxidoreductase [Mucilaginibacter gotjawali]|uniref:DSBA-like thioredoxin domain protein n=2 Tax=Mucilaginibacter gotjawali TaxID=1550579 RepID=A0A110B1A5_9SPHI|nr:DsbA family oxidoreductase [Mucilaginibacter gotjawali]MBB3057326.1 putative DsbA family dithiol-disulfide isomerase [Mucilaginibacter gotjawali]BAU52908.1 DSBA-like thioredoxin domain protein [Mucilaginibacter gotjawali]
MKVEIWSDVMCPFCYIGKRRFEQALAGFAQQEDIEVEWKSFQLNPNMVTNPAISIDQYLAEVKGFTLDHAKQLNNHVTQMAAEVGLTYNFDRSVVANSFNAHRYSHLAKKQGKGIEAEEQLFRAYFTDGKNIDDLDTLVELGTAIGLDATEVRKTLESNAFADEVKRDIAEAQQLGIQGVPFFVMNNKYGVSGAQAVPVFEQTLQKAYTEWQQENPKPKLEIIEGESCGPDGDC